MPKADPSQGVLPVESPHNSQRLFAPHYLDSPDRLRSLKQWREVAGVAEAMDAIGDLYKKSASRFGPKTKESQTEDRFIKPVLRMLGWEWEAQEGIEGHGIPDYALLFSQEDWEALQDKKGTDEFWASVPVLADAKAWEVSLDQKRDGETPTVQITNYLYRSNVRWGILTNGQKWRLYERDKSRAGGIYYEVDLIELLERGSAEDFKYFYLFFRRDGFVPVDGISFVERVFQGSIDYATEVGDRLKESVYDALRCLMNGFLGHQANGLDRHDEDTLRQVHDHCLILLYRLLFVFYAEDGGLLPVSDDAYSSYSLKALQQRVNKQVREGPRFLPTAVTLWHDLLNLFSLIDTGHYENGRCVIPAYNGGLFSDERFPLIAHTPSTGAARWDIGDLYLAQAIDMLAYKRERWDEPGTEDVDYATLDVQHLGAIYEGLLELKPQVATEPLIEQPGRRGKGPVVIPQGKVAKAKKVRGQTPRTFAADEVYLVTDRGERKATGSYYTPKYIVDYIVENTVVPLCDEAAKQTAEIRKQIDALEKKRRRVRRGDSIRAVDQELGELTQRRLEPYLSLKILDPAMGSGHFLVGAADVISLAMATDPNLPDVPDEEADDPQGYYKRLVAGHCLYGVDLNWLAVELAKLSLWLHTVQKDKALDFLDHHLRCGNSLIGARIEHDLAKDPPRLDAKAVQVEAEGGQLLLGFWESFSQKHLQGFLNTIQRIMDAPAPDAEAQRRKEEWFREMERERDRYRQVANCWLAPYFGVPVSAEQYGQAVAALRKSATSEQWTSLVDEPWFQDAYAVGGNIRAEPDRDDWRAAIERELAQREGLPQPRRFFHWELEFPHAFFAGAGWKPGDARGFDAVIGNPPYVSSRDEASLAPFRACLERAYTCIEAQTELYALFVELGLRSSRHRVGMIVPDPWVSNVTDEVLRLLVLQATAGSTIATPSARVFEQDVDVLVLTAHVGQAPGNRQLEVRTLGQDRAYPSRGQLQYAEIEQTPSRIVPLAKSGLTVARLQRWAAGGRPFGEICEIARGVGAYHHTKHPGEVIASRAFHADHKKDDTFVPELRGQDIGRYSLQWDGTNWVSYGPWLKEPRYPELFRGPRLLLRKIIGETFYCTYTDEDWIVDQQVYVALPPSTSVDIRAYLAVLNARLTGLCFRDYHNQWGLFPHLNVTQFRRLRIPDFEDPPLRIHELSESSEFISRAQKAAFPTPDGGDFVHDLLARLAERMIDFNRQKRAGVDEFLQWLESYAGCKVDELSGKTKVQAFHEHEVDEVVDVLRRNKKRISKVDATTAAFVSKVTSEYDTATAALTPMLEALEKTDRLIDHIVYRLYGLTDEEIAIVEESAG